MSGARRGLVAPQNTFLENIIRRCNGQHNSFILANARILDYPIVYCNDGFYKLTGFNRAEVMQQSCMCHFLWPNHSVPTADGNNRITDKNKNSNKNDNNNNDSSSGNSSRSSSISSCGDITASGGHNNNNNRNKDDADDNRNADAAMTKLQVAMDRHEPGKVEIILYKKNKEPINVIIEEFPIKNENRNVIFFLLTFMDITMYRQQAESDRKFVTFAKLARSMTKKPQQPNSVTGTAPGSAGGGGGSSSSSNSNVLSRKSAANQNTPYEDLNISTDKEKGKDFSVKADQLVSIFSLHSDLMPQYKQEAPKTPPEILLHYSTFKTCWDWLILLLTGYTAVMVPFNVAFNSRTLENITLLIVDSVVDVFFFIDIVLNFHTTFVGPSGEIISDPTIIRINYLKGWFLIDLLSCLPYDVFNAFEPEADEARGVSQLFGALKVVRLLRLGRVLRKMDQYMEYMAAILALMMFGFLLLAHWLACAWFSIGRQDIQDHIYYGWIPKMLTDSGISVDRSINSTIYARPVDVQQSYVTSLYFTLSLLTTIGFGNVNGNTILEKWLCILFMIMGALVYAIIFGNVTTIFQQFYASRAHYQDIMKNVKDFMTLYEIPRQLSERVIDYITSSWVITKGIDTNLVLNFCPKDMKADLCVHMNRMVFTEHPAFRLASDGCLRALAVEFQTLHSAPGDLIFHQGESIEQLSFVVSGSLEILQDGEIVAILGKGDVFGDNLWKEATVGQSAATVRALTYCDLHYIRRDKLLEVLKFYHAFGNSFSRNLLLTYNLRNRIIFRKISDVQRELCISEQRKTEPNLFSSVASSSMNKLIAKFKKLSDSAGGGSVSSGHADATTTTTNTNTITSTAAITSDYDASAPPTTAAAAAAAAIQIKGDTKTILRADNITRMSASESADAPRVHFLRIKQKTPDSNTYSDNTYFSSSTAGGKSIATDCISGRKGSVSQSHEIKEAERKASIAKLKEAECCYHTDYIQKLVDELKMDMKHKVTNLDDKANAIEQKVAILYSKILLLTNY